jgi:hypothetical protein
MTILHMIRQGRHEPRIGQGEPQRADRLTPK